MSEKSTNDALEAIGCGLAIMLILIGVGSCTFLSRLEFKATVPQVITTTPTEEPK